MMMMQAHLPALALCAALLLSAGVCGFVSDRKPPQGKERKVQMASWDEVNVIAHGLLQLGHGLKEHVDRTKVQLRDLGGRLGAQNLSLAEVRRGAQQAHEQSQVLRSRVQALEGQQSQVTNASQNLQGAVQQLSRGAANLDRRMERIESRIQQLEQPREEEGGPGGVSHLGPDMDTVQSLMDAQNKRIDDLLEKIKLQQYKLDKQNLQIKSLQSKMQDNKTPSPTWMSILRKRTKDVSQRQNGSSASEEAAGLPSDCHQLFLDGERTSGIFSIQPRESEPIQVYCEMATDGGWTVIHRRVDGSEDFDRLWEAYQSGFGNITGEFWLGLENMYTIAQQGKYSLRVDLQDWEETSQSIELLFTLGGQNTGYALQIQSMVSGELENAIGDIRPLPFSTRDRDQDLKSDLNCAKHLTGGWWFSSCGHSNLNGKYFRSIPRQRHERKQGIFWKTWKGRYYPLRSASMKIRPTEMGV